MKLGATEMIMLLFIPVLIFLFGYWVGKVAGRNAAYKEFMNKNS